MSSTTWYSQTFSIFKVHAIPSCERRVSSLKKKLLCQGEISGTLVPVNHNVETVGYVIRDDVAPLGSIAAISISQTEVTWQVAA